MDNQLDVIVTIGGGADGYTPIIGANANWWINGYDTGIKADYSSEESLRAQEEALRVSAESARIKAEELRVSNELIREREFALIQKAISDAIASLQQLSTSVEASECNRNINEELRNQSEADRMSSEDDRELNETNRVAEETKRIEAETLRGQQEESRKTAETNRVAEDNKRKDAETLRNQQEEARKTAEAKRVAEEDKRIDAERLRAEKDAGRDAKITAVENKNAQLEQEVSQTQAKLSYVDLDGKSMTLVFTQGGVDYPANGETAELHRIRTEMIKCDNCSINVSIGANFLCAIQNYTFDNKGISDTGWISERCVDIQSGYIRVLLRKKDDTNIIPSEYNTSGLSLMMLNREIIQAASIYDAGGFITFSMGIAPKISVNNTTITVEFVQNGMFLIDKYGKEFASIKNLIGRRISVNTGEVLVFNVRKNDFEIYNNNAYRGSECVLLLQNSYGKAYSGLLSTVLMNDTRVYDSEQLCPVFNGTWRIVNYDTKTSTLSFPEGASLIYRNAKYDLSNKSIVCKPSAYPETSAPKIYFNCITRELVTEIPDYISKDTNIALVALIRKPTNTVSITCEYTVDGERVIRGTRSIPLAQEYKSKQKTNLCANQGLTVVANELWHYAASNDENTNYANILRWDIDSWEQLPSHTHNFGHCASADYNALHDAMITGNGTSNTSILPRLDIITNVKSLCGKVANKLDIKGATSISIPFFTSSKQIGGSGLIACWGEGNIVYLLTGQNEPRKIFKCVLGTGTNDFSDKSTNGDDLTKWGVFISGKGENEFNGTAKILSTYTGDETGVYQGVCYKDGYIYLVCGFTEPIVWKIRLNNNGKYDLIESITPCTYNNEGVKVNYEPEGVCIDRDYMYIGLVGKGSKIIAIPLYNKQSGIGRVRERVIFDFPTNSIPIVAITPTSDCTDMYISSIDSNGFTVLSKSSASGSFMWQCNI